MSLQLRKNIIDISIHCFIAAVLCSVIYFKTGSARYAFVFLLGSVFIDLDHLIDHFAYSNNKFSLVDFISSNHCKSGKIFIFFHSWELNIVLFVLAAVFRSEWLFVLAAGMVVHLATDVIVHKKLVPYFLIYRMAKGFDAKLFGMIERRPEYR